MMWSDQLFIDIVLPFGLRSTPKIFCAIADALEWILYQRGISSSLHYLDDLLTMGPPNSDRCAANLQLISVTCNYLGLPPKSQKVEGPTTSLTFLGIILDTTHMELRLTQDKIQHLKMSVAKWSKRKACKKKELLSLIGSLSHACAVIPPGRTFMRRLITTSCRAKNLSHWIRLDAEFRSDLAWWLSFLDTWNGHSMMEIHAPSWNPNIEFSSDTSG